MKRALGLLMACVAVVGFHAPAVSAVYPPGTPTVSSSSSSPLPGAQITLSAAGFCAGATGWVTGVADVAPAQCVALYDHCRAGELDAAREVYRRLLPLGRFDMTPKLVQYFKAAMDEVGFAGGPTRAPRLPLDDDERGALRAALATLGVGVHA